MALKPRPAIDRFAEKIALTESGCIQWIAGTTNNGYGTFFAGDAVVVAHRWSYEYHVGPIPPGRQLDHLCLNRACVNPGHLDPVTPRANLLRADGITARNASRTHCPTGHEYAGDNLYIHPKTGDRHCRACTRARLSRLRNNARKAA